MIRTRIAPTPSGYLHKGNVFNFLYTAFLAKEGKIFLRIDDIDAGRIRDEYIRNIFEVITLVNIKIDEGPGYFEELSKYSQHNNLLEYESYIFKLRDNGHLYACTCSRSMLQELNHCECKKQKKPFADDVNWRLITPDKPVTFYDKLLKNHISIHLTEAMPDPVIRKKDGLPSYQIVSLIEDVKMKINVIVRGEDLFTSTATQLYLAQILNLDSFKEISFYHHPLIKDEKGNKLSKSSGSMSIAPYLDSLNLEELLEEFEAWKRSFMP